MVTCDICLACRIKIIIKSLLWPLADSWRRRVTEGEDRPVTPQKKRPTTLKHTVHVLFIAFCKLLVSSDLFLYLKRMFYSDLSAVVWDF